jgi:dCTP deaminase
VADSSGFTNINNTLIDPKNFDPLVRRHQIEYLHRPAELLRLARTISAPYSGRADGVPGEVSTRGGIIVNVTPFEPEWEGTATLGSQHHAAAGEDLRQRGHRSGVVLSGDEPCEISYGQEGKASSSRSHAASI